MQRATKSGAHCGRLVSGDPAVTGKIGARMSAKQPPHGSNTPGSPGGRGGYDVDDKVFFTHQSGGPSSGHVACKGAHYERCAERDNKLA